MTDRTLRDQIASLPRYEPDYCDRMGNRSDMIDEPEGDWLSRDAVLALLAAHTAEQPAPDAVAEAEKGQRFALSVDQSKLFDYLRDASNTDEALRIVGSRIVTSLLSGGPGFAEAIVMELAGISLAKGHQP